MGVVVESPLGAGSARRVTGNVRDTQKNVPADRRPCPCRRRRDRRLERAVGRLGAPRVRVRAGAHRVRRQVLAATPEHPVGEHGEQVALAHARRDRRLERRRASPSGSRRCARNSRTSSGVLTSRAASVVGAESTNVYPSALQREEPGRAEPVERRSRFAVTPSSRIAAAISSAHPSAARRRRRRTPTRASAERPLASVRGRCTEFGCSNRIGVPSTGTSAHRTNVRHRSRSASPWRRSRSGCSAR